MEASDRERTGSRLLSWLLPPKEKQTANLDQSVHAFASMHDDVVVTQCGQLAKNVTILGMQDKGDLCHNPLHGTCPNALDGWSSATSEHTVVRRVLRQFNSSTTRLHNAECTLGEWSTCEHDREEQVCRDLASQWHMITIGRLDTANCMCYCSLNPRHHIVGGHARELPGKHGPK